MADAVIPHPPYANPWNSCQESSPSQFSSSPCPNPHSRPLCRFDRPPSPTSPLLLLLLLLLLRLDNFLLTYSHNFFLLPKNVWIYGVWISTTSPFFILLWTSKQPSMHSHMYMCITHTKKEHLVPKHREICVIREVEKGINTEFGAIITVSLFLIWILVYM
jgi:hypothetical protein